MAHASAETNRPRTAAGILAILLGSGVLFAVILSDAGAGPGAGVLLLVGLTFLVGGTLSVGTTGTDRVM